MDEKITTSATENAESTDQAEQAAAPAQGGAQNGTATETVTQFEPQAEQKAEPSGNSETGKADGKKSDSAESTGESDNSQEENKQEIDELIRVKAEIEHTISAVADERLRLILIARYINCKTFEYIACEMHYSYKQICRLHGKALLRMQDVLECPIASVI